MRFSKSGSVVYRGAMCEGERKKTNLFSEIAQGERDLRILFYLIKILIFVTGAKKFRSEHRSRTCQFTFVVCKRPNGNILGAKINFTGTSLNWYVVIFSFNGFVLENNHT